MVLEGLLAGAVSDPKQILPFNGGAFLSLALHCLMVDNGFVTVDERGIAHLGARSQYHPFPSWNSRSSEWVFLYARRGAANRFRLHTALHPTTGRLFVHASELRWGDDAPLEGKIALLGLQLQNYVQVAEGAALKSSSWEGIFTNQQQLQQLFQEHVLTLLTSRADPLPGSPLALPPAVKNSAGNRLVRGVQVAHDWVAAAAEGALRGVSRGSGTGLLLLALAAIVAGTAVGVAAKGRPMLKR